MGSTTGSDANYRHLSKEVSQKDLWLFIQADKDI